MHGHGARPRRILLPESIPRHRLRDLRRELESPRRAKAQSARLLARGFMILWWPLALLRPSGRGGNAADKAGYISRLSRLVAVTLPEKIQNLPADELIKATRR
jgi:hypothetical protein